MMKRCFILITLLLLAGSAFGQIYRVYRPEPDAAAEDPAPRVEREPYVSAEVAGVYHFGKVADTDGNTVAKHFTGMRGSLWVHVWQPFWIGVETSEVKAKHQHLDALEKIKYRENIGLIKWILTPDVEPKVYMLLGVGRREYRTKLSWMSHSYDEGDIIYVAGLGGDVRLYRGLLLSGQYRWVQERHRWEPTFLRGPRTHHELSLGLRYEF